MTLFDDTTDFNNLYSAYKSAAKGKHDRAEVLRHDLHAEKILLTLQRQLRDGSYKHGKYRTFKVYDPKQRNVAAAPFTDRIVHHALVQVIEPLFEPGFIYDSYACRVGKGTHAAVLRLQHFLRSAHDKYGEFYVLRADIRKFFASIDHGVIIQLLARRLHDRQTLWLCQKVIASYHEPKIESIATGGGGDASRQLKTGLPIGNLTSQLFANIYLNQLDQFAKHDLREALYIRYMDDFLIIHPSKSHLHEAQKLLEWFVKNQLVLELHPKKTHIHKFTGTERFVGYDAQLFVRRLSKPTVQRFLRRMKRVARHADNAVMRASWQQFQAYSTFAHAKGLMRAISPQTGDSQHEP